MNKPHIYKTTCKINNMFYYGVHNGSNTENYYGSGIALKDCIAKYGIDNFSKEILLWFDTVEEAYEYEAVIVNEKMLKNKKCLNLKIGGFGGWPPRKDKTSPNKGRSLTQEWKDNISKSVKGRIVSSDTRNKLSKTLKGREFTDEWKKKISQKAQSRPEVVCPHCKKQGQKAAMGRWHFDNCKLKTNPQGEK